MNQAIIALNNEYDLFQHGHGKVSCGTKSKLWSKGQLHGALSTLNLGWSMEKRGSAEVCHVYPGFHLLYLCIHNTLHDFMTVTNLMFLEIDFVPLLQKSPFQDQKSVLSQTLDKKTLDTTNPRHY